MLARTELHDKPGYWNLDEDVIVGGTFIPRGFIWDLCSKPPWAKYIGYRQDDERTEKAGLRHDLEYYTHKFSRAETDKRYREQAIADGYPKRKAWVEWLAIRACGGSHWNNDAEDKKLIQSMLWTWRNMGGKYLDFAREINLLINC